jgi:cytochrome P450
MDGLPPGPGAPPALQTLEWIARPTVLLRRSAARYGEPFTLRTLWTDAPMVVVSDAATVRRIYAEPPDVLRGGASSAVIEPFVGPGSVLVLDGEPHLRRRRELCRRCTASGCSRTATASPPSPARRSPAGPPARRCGRCRACRRSRSR